MEREETCPGDQGVVDRGILDQELADLAPEWTMNPAFQLSLNHRRNGVGGIDHGAYLEVKTCRAIPQQIAAVIATERGVPRQAKSSDTVRVRLRMFASFAAVFVWP